MEGTPRSPEKKQKGMDIDACIAKADELIQKNGMCLFLMDIVGSSGLNSAQLDEDFDNLLKDLDAKYASYLPENGLTNRRKEQGFHRILGDAATGAINDSAVIPLIAGHAVDNYPQLPLRYSVAKDGWDEEAIALIK